MSDTNTIGKHWPPFLLDILDFAELSRTQDAEVKDAQAAVEGLLLDQFVTSSGLQAIKRREQMLGIQADPQTESLAFRKKRVLNRYRTKPPFTLHYLQQQLDALVGPGMTVVSVDVRSFVLTVTANIENANVFREVIHTIETIKPANLIYQQNTSIKGTIGLEERISRRDVAWNYKLDGSWKLGEKPFASLGPEVVVT
ncbi:phage portal protein [Paenibacillus cisolokensis]|uniref:Phage portal protein n=1 Tax=Paenibacillus cisolokensis TaxID=1658519 RepID=A0ABQ4N2D2_9BACL|nr:putative phage tail protein [Paenibacillus cisolokensis]GIQ62131.1 phage portal protein [Paenibacillus cisolokensis]